MTSSMMLLSFQSVCDCLDMLRFLPRFQLKEKGYQKFRHKINGKLKSKEILEFSTPAADTLCTLNVPVCVPVPLPENAGRGWGSPGTAGATIDMEHAETVSSSLGAPRSPVPAIRQNAEIILNKSLRARVVVVVSAMGDTTDQLLSLARRVHPDPPVREQDMLVSVARGSASPCRDGSPPEGQGCDQFHGSQSGIITSQSIRKPAFWM